MQMRLSAAITHKGYTEERRMRVKDMLDEYTKSVVNPSKDPNNAIVIAAHDRSKTHTAVEGERQMILGSMAYLVRHVAIRTGMTIDEVIDTVAARAHFIDRKQGSVH